MGLSSRIHQISSSNPLCAYRPGVVGELVLNAVVNLFTVRGGDVHVSGMHGKITANIGANNTTVQLRIIPTAGAQQALSNPSGNLTGLIINRYLEPTGVLAGAIVTEAATYGVGIIYMATNPWTLTPGIINILVGGATTLTGAIDWYIEYRPLSPGAEITPL